MDAQILDKVSEQVYRKFPEVAGSKPKVQSQGDTENVLITYHGTVTTADGKKMPRTVRVVASPSGKIIKMTTSR